jgi:hypothetical protein
VAAVLSMSKQEFSRLEVLLRVQSGHLRVSDACVLIGLQRRQVFRVLRGLKQDGATSLSEAMIASSYSGVTASLLTEPIMTHVQSGNGNGATKHFAEYLCPCDLRQQLPESLQGARLAHRLVPLVGCQRDFRSAAASSQTAELALAGASEHETMKRDYRRRFHAISHLFACGCRAAVPP